MPECFVAKASELNDGDRRIVIAGREEIGVFFKDGAYFAYSNYCVHSGGPACEGLMINRVIDVIEDLCTVDDEEDWDEFRRLKEDLRTRLDNETFEAEFAHLPYETVIRTLHRDLGLPEPEFGPPDRVRAMIWDAQWGERTPPEPPPGEPDPPPPEPYFRYSSG